jgi:hypothetical protein
MGDDKDDHVDEVQEVRDTHFKKKELAAMLEDRRNKYNREAEKLSSEPLSEKRDRAERELMCLFFADTFITATERMMNMHQISGSKLVVDSALDKDLRTYLADTLTLEVHPCLEQIKDTMEELEPLANQLDVSKGRDNIILAVQSMGDALERSMDYIEDYVKDMGKKDWNAGETMKKDIEKVYIKLAKRVIGIAEDLEEVFRHKLDVHTSLCHETIRLNKKMYHVLKKNLKAA